MTSMLTSRAHIFICSGTTHAGETAMLTARGEGNETRLQPPERGSVSGYGARISFRLAEGEGG